MAVNGLENKFGYHFMVINIEKPNKVQLWLGVEYLYLPT